MRATSQQRAAEQQQGKREGGEGAARSSESRPTSAPARDPKGLRGDQLEGVGRNDPCPCGSGKKYKKCHG